MAFSTVCLIHSSFCACSCGDICAAPAQVGLPGLALSGGVRAAWQPADSLLCTLHCLQSGGLLLLLLLSVKRWHVARSAAVTSAWTQERSPVPLTLRGGPKQAHLHGQAALVEGVHAAGQLVQEPGMLHDLGGGQPLGGVQHQQAAQQVRHVRADARLARDLVVDPQRARQHLRRTPAGLPVRCRRLALGCASRQGQQAPARAATGTGLHTRMRGGPHLGSALGPLRVVRPLKGVACTQGALVSQRARYLLRTGASKGPSGGAILIQPTAGLQPC